MVAKQTSANHPALIDSSTTIFSLLASVFWAWVLSRSFPHLAQQKAFGMLILLAVVLFLFSYFLRQFWEGISVLRAYLLFVSVMALLSFISAVRGPITDGLIPAMQLFWIGPKIVSGGAGYGYIIGSTFVFYGFVAYLMGLFSTVILEFLYARTHVLLPQTIRRKLLRTDAAVDRTSMRFSDDMFLLSDQKGLALVMIVFTLYIAAYFVYLII